MMKQLRVPGIILGFFLLGVPLFPSTLSVMVVETGVNEDTPRLDASSLWEGGLMDVCFDTGHIVTNAPILRLERNQIRTYPDEGFLDIDGAIESGVEFYILAVLDYELRPQDDPSTYRPRSIALRFVRLAPRRVLFEVQYTGDPRSSLAEASRQAKEAARVLLSHFEG
ncbi:MAG: hypothetical protein LBK40_09490 [Spirochaetaceae bacterium]|jgi:hypothetical protein|nr:hypothetical protein [Spirochaetaceae bacterium]